MEIEIKNLKDIQNNLLEFLDSEENLSFISLEKKLNQQFMKNRQILKLFLCLIAKIANNHFRCPLFFQKIEKILNFFQIEINQNFTNYEIFKIFQSNKRLLLFLIKKGIINIDFQIIHNINIYYFYYEIIHFLLEFPDKNSNWNNYDESEIFDEMNSKINEYSDTFYYGQQDESDEFNNEFFNNKNFCLNNLLLPKLTFNGKNNSENFINYSESTIKFIQELGYEEFDRLRTIGENESYICQMIRNDSVEEFIQYVNKKNISSSSQIPQSIFETNPFLIKRSVSLIEYSAFFGSIQIFNYLFICNAEVEPSILLFAIHGKNADIIHFLENIIDPTKDFLYKKCLNESIKCHHVDISEYILNCYFDNTNDFARYEPSIKYFNFNYFPTINVIGDYFYYLCKYDYYKFVEIIINSNETINFDINKKAKENIKSDLTCYFGCMLSFDLIKKCIRQFIYEQSFPLYPNDNKYEILTTPIKIALRKGNKEIYKLLLKDRRFEIVNCCFSFCNEIKDIIIPLSATKIGLRAFQCCKSLTRVVIPISVKEINTYAFKDCQSLTQILIPYSTYLIEKYAFCGCSSLTKVIFQSSMKIIGIYAFSECSKLKEIVFDQNYDNKCSLNELISIIMKYFEPNNNSSFNFTEYFCPILMKENFDFSFESFKEIFNDLGTTIISNNAYYDCKELESFSFPFGLLLINEQIFDKCNSLKKISIPSSVIKIVDFAFEYCTALQEVIFPDSVTYIGCYSFFGCSSIKHIKLPSKLSQINESAFEECSSLEEIEFPSSVKKIGMFSFNQCSSLKLISIHSNEIKIFNYAFMNCKKLKQVVIPSRKVEIEKNAFSSSTLVIHFNFNKC